MKPGRPASKKIVKRDCLETAQAEMVGLLRDLDEVILRTQQAMRRTPLVGDVLEPSVERLRQIRASIRIVQREIGTAWAVGQAVNWRMYEE